MLTYYFKYLFKVPPIEEFIKHNSILKKTSYKTISDISNYKLEEIYKQYINKYKNKINWEEFSFIVPENIINVSNDYGYNLRSLVNWYVVSTRSDLTEDFMFSNRNILNWNILSGKCAKLYQRIETMKIFKEYINIKDFFTSRDLSYEYDIDYNRTYHKFRLNIFKDAIHDYKKEYTYLNALFFYKKSFLINDSRDIITESNMINWNNYYSDWVYNIFSFEKKYIEENKKHINNISNLPNTSIIYDIIMYYPIDLKVIQNILNIYEDFISIKRDILELSQINCFLKNLEKDEIFNKLRILYEKIEKENTIKKRIERTLFLDLED
ncbi:MAG: hypothetical protein WC942_05410 [Clostridia bacterium]|jgi:hypothetical protein